VGTVGPYQRNKLAGLPALLVLSISIGVRPAWAYEPSDPVRDSAATTAASLVDEDRVWFAPNIGSLDMLDLFDSPQRWATARSKTHIFSFYMKQAGSEGWSCDSIPNANCGPNNLQNLIAVDAFAKLGSWGIDIGLEAFFAGPIASVDPIVCASAEHVRNLTLSGTANAINNVHANGGTVRYLVMDEPIWQWYPAEFYIATGQTDPRPCLADSLDVVADHVANYVLFMQDALPSVLIGQVELYPESRVARLKDWILALEARGVALSFLHLDVHGPRIAQYNDLGMEVDVAADIIELKSFLTAHNIALGVIVTDVNWDSQLWEEDQYDDAAYFGRTMEWVDELKPVAESIDHFVFQSWIAPYYTTGPGPRQIPTNLPDDDVALPTHTRLIHSAVPILLSEPAVPATSFWGMITMSLLMITLATLILSKSRAPMPRPKSSNVS
jgi:hypothetical protein